MNLNDTNQLQINIVTSHILNMREEIFTVREVADRLRVTEQVVYKWLQAGKLKGIKVGRHWRVRESDLERFLQ
jgi:excisionase family DNA binding protein